MVKFSDPVYRHNPDYTLALNQGVPSKDRPSQLLRPTLFLRTSCHLRDAETRSEYRFSKSIDIKGGLDKSIVSWETREDITPEHRSEWSGKNKTDNLVATEKRLDYYLTYAQQRFTPKTPASGSYPWLVPYSPDGRIAQVVFEIDGEGFIGTAIYREIEGLLNIATYTDRRQEVARLATQQMLARDLTKQNKQ